ncbi:DNA alkylation repair protein [Actinotalea sp. M2MS4P-6]|uniref:DNA alkylation repair protein n=1 Tax=Actinotalea sp. M2MS4P-6 TaxID=2983762 RepID=UPI0021E50C62|nr:DNA alkylation repair protein [Actinotalea sp. M2MS4P-6]MCV2396060.1 DNA alkylation repair protein [Actinotalea sp. M2MS4P-6]
MRPAPGAGSTAAEVRAAVLDLADPDRAAGLARYFQTGPGQYGEGDTFVGVMVPGVRGVVRAHRGLGSSEIGVLLDDPVHEVRLAAVLLLVEHSRRAPEEALALYLDALHRGRVNNWDLVDLSAKQVIGVAVQHGDRALLDRLAASGSVWERRAAVLATFPFLAAGDASTSLELAERLLDDPHPLMHKAVGWMLRETGVRVGRDVLTGFLDVHAAAMPRVMLSYATEHLDPEQRAHYRALR